MVSLQLPHGSLDYASNLLGPRQPDVSVGSCTAPSDRRLSLFRGIAVGTQVAPRPPHRSGRAQLRHPAPTLGGDGKANAWPWMKDFGLREKVIGQPCHPLP